MRREFLAAIPLICVALISILWAAPVIDTEITCVKTTITSQTILDIPVTRDVSGILRIGKPTESKLPAEFRESIVGFSRFGKDREFIATYDTNSKQENFFTCLQNRTALSFECSRLPISSSAPTATSIGLFQSNAVLNIILQRQNQEFSAGLLFNPQTGKLKGARFPFYNSPEQLFPLTPFPIIGSAGISQDGSTTFQLINYGQQFGSDYFFFRHNNPMTLRPSGPFTKTLMPTNDAYLTGGSITNRLQDPNGGPDFQLFAYQQLNHFLQPNMTIQIMLQKLNADTLLPIGPPKTIAPPTPTHFENLELKPGLSIEFQAGMYLTYGKFSDLCDKELLELRPIDASGNPGAPRHVLTCDDLKDSSEGVGTVTVHEIPVM